jgi:hypothetical protein
MPPWSFTGITFTFFLVLYKYRYHPLLCFKFNFCAALLFLSSKPSSWRFPSVGGQLNQFKLYTILTIVGLIKKRRPRLFLSEVKEYESIGNRVHWLGLYHWVSWFRAPPTWCSLFAMLASECPPVLLPQAAVCCRPAGSTAKPEPHFLHLIP